MFTKLMQPMMSYPKPFQSEVEGSSFAGSAVAIAPSGDGDVEQEMHAPASTIISRLERVKPTTPEIQTMIDNLRAIEFAANQVIAAYETERREELDAALEEVRKEGRAQQKIIDTLEADRQQLEFQFHAARNHAENCRDQLSDLRTTKVSRWTSEADRQALRTKIAKAQAAVREANEQMARASGEHNRAADALAEAHEVMGKISNRELVVRGERSGQVYYDPETALPVLPR